jgi:hypothetical protein
MRGAEERRSGGVMEYWSGAWRMGRMERKNKNRGYQRLRVWQDAITLYVETCRLFKPQAFEIMRVAGQAIASADSIHRNRMRSTQVKTATTNHSRHNPGMQSRPRADAKLDFPNELTSNSKMFSCGFHSTAPTLHCSNTPPLHTPSLHHSITPLLRCSITPLFLHSGKWSI